MFTPSPSAKLCVVDPPIGSVLVVEEMPAVGNLTVRLLTLHGWEARTCNEIPREVPPLEEPGQLVDVLIIDANLCAGSRWANIERLLKRHPRAAVVLTTTGTDPLLPEQLCCRVDGVLAKPFGPDDLVGAVRSAQQAFSTLAT